VRASVGSVQEGNILDRGFAISYCTIGSGPLNGPKVEVRRMSHQQKDLRWQKNLGPRTFWREGGGVSRFIRHVEPGDQDKITPGDPARGENTALRDAAEETS
jgi:hypothetical protein